MSEISISKKEEAIPLLTVDTNTKKYTLNTEALEVLKSIPEPIAVVAVAGLYRTGKSY